jgi:hypothetical protein
MLRDVECDVVPFFFGGGVYIGKQVQLHSYLTSALDRAEGSASLPGCFTPTEEPQYSLNRRLNWPQSWSGCFGKQNLFSVPVIERRLLGLPALSLVF